MSSLPPPPPSTSTSAPLSPLPPHKLHPLHTSLPTCFDRDHFSSYLSSQVAKLKILVENTTTVNCDRTAKIALKLLRKVNDNYISLESAFIMSLVKVFIELAHETTDGPTTCVTIVKGAEALWALLQDELDHYSNKASPSEPTELIFHIHWRPLYAGLVLQSPFLDETLVTHRANLNAKNDNDMREKQMNFIQDARHYFPQFKTSQSSSEISTFVAHDLSQVHSCICFRAQITLVLFLPTCASPEFYERMVPVWCKAWGGVDSCPGWDTNFLSLFCRGRKHAPSNFDWREVEKQVYSRAIHFLRIPVGSTGDTAFMAQNQPYRSFNHKFKVFASGTNFGSSVSKLCKLMTFWLGSGLKSPRGISTGTTNFLKFWEYISPYFNPSNYGEWTIHLGVTLQYTCRLLAMRVGIELGKEDLRKEGGDEKARLAYYPANPLSPTELLHIINTLLPLVYQIIYSKHQGISHCGDVALRCLGTICPRAITPPTVQFLSDALSLNSINQTHQAPVALRSIHGIVKLMIRTKCSPFFKHLPSLLDLSIQGIDCNDDSKTQSTFLFFSSLLEWIPIGSEDKDGPPSTPPSTPLSEFFDISTDPEWQAAAALLPTSSPLFSPPFDPSLEDNFPYEVSEASDYLSHWALQLLDRIYTLFKAADPMMKKVKAGHSAHSSGSINQRARQDQASASYSNYACIMLLSSLPLPIYKKALTSIADFISASTYSNAFKQVSNLCKAACCPHPELAMEKLFPLLSGDIASLSGSIATYRLRLLCGLVKKTGVALLKYRDQLTDVIGFALKSDDKKLRKAGNKLFRHTLSSLTTYYILTSESIPKRDLPPGTPGAFETNSAGEQFLKVKWHVPSGAEVDFAVSLIESFIVPSMKAMEETIAAGKEGSLDKWRRATKTVFYGLRGCIGILNDRRGDKSDEGNEFGFNSSDSLSNLIQNVGGDEDDEDEGEDDFDMEDTSDVNEDGDVEAMRMEVDSVLISKAPLEYLHPHEKATFEILAASSLHSQEFLAPLRFQLSELVGKCLAEVSTVLEPEFEFQRDRKGAKELVNCAEMLLMRRIPKRGINFTLDAYDGKVDSEKNTVQTERTFIVIDGNQRYNKHYKIKPGSLLSGKAISSNYMALRVELLVKDLARKAAQEIPLRIRKNANSRIKDPLDTSTLASYDKLIDGLLGLMSHTNVEVSSSSMAVLDKTKMVGWCWKERTPRLMATMDLSDASLKKKFGVPVTQDYGASNPESIRLYEVVKGSMLVMARNMPRIIDPKNSYHFIRKFFMVEDAVIKRIPEEEKARHVEVLMNALWEGFRACFDFEIGPSTKAGVKKAHRECLDHLLGLLEGEGGGEWKRRLTIVWFLMHMIGDEEGRDAELAGRLWKVGCGLVESEMEGMPLQRAALGMLGRLTKVLDDGVKEDVGFKGLVEARMCDASFCSKLVNGLAAAHKSKSTREQWSKGVGTMLKDFAAKCGGTQTFPSLRDSLISYTFKIKHVMLIERMMSLLDRSIRGKAAELLLVKCKEMALMPPTEDQVNQHCAAAEVFGGVCKSLLGSYQGVENAEEAWGIMLPFLEDVLEVIQTKAIGDWSDGIRYGIHRAGVRETKMILDMLVGRVAGNMWEDRGVGGEEGFANSVKWMKLLSPILIELSYVEPKVGLLERVIGGMGVGGGEGWEEEAKVRVKMVEEVSEVLLGKFLGALCHPFKQCRIWISTLLMMLTGTTAANHVLGIEGSCDPVVRKFEEVLLGEAVGSAEKERKKKGRETLCVFIFKCIHLGDVERYYGKMIVRLLPCIFSCLEVEESGEEGGEGEENVKDEGVREGMSMTRQTIATLATACLLLYPGSSSSMSSCLLVAGGVCSHRNWQVRQAACIFLGRFFSSHKFTLGEDENKRIFDLTCKLLGDERREVSQSATAGLTGMLAVMGEDEVGVLVGEYCGVADKSLRRKCRKGKGTSEAGTNEGGEEKEKKEKKEEERKRRQRISVSVLCAAVHSAPYCVPPFVPPAIHSLSRHSFESSAPIGVRDMVKKTCSDFKRTHVDNWVIEKGKFNREQLEGLEDVVTCHYYA